MIDFYDKFKEMVEKNGEEIIYTWLDKNGNEEKHITYKELYEKILVIIENEKFSKIKQKRIGLIFKPGIDFVLYFLAVTYSGNISVPISPLKNKESVNRIERILADADLYRVICDKENFIRLNNNQIYEMACSKEELVQKKGFDNFKEYKHESNELFMIQYTSGSTGEPKGVEITNHNMLSNQKEISKLMKTDKNIIMVSWLPQYHDMGLIGGILHPFYLGGKCILMSPDTFIRNPSIWLNSISKYKANISGGPNFAYEICIKRCKNISELDLSTWKVAFNGAEPVRKSTLETFYEKFKGNGFKKYSFFPCYGLAEATLIVSGTWYNPQNIHTVKNENNKEKDFVSCGNINENFKIFNEGNICEELEEGEIFITGESVSKGYYGKDINTGKMKEYRSTGDRGFLFNNNLYVTGRIKEMIVINGKNYYPSDLEQLFNAKINENIKELAFFGSKDEEIEVFSCAVVAENINKDEKQQIDKMIRKNIFNNFNLKIKNIYYISSSLPRTTSGKLKRYEIKNICENGNV